MQIITKACIAYSLPTVTLLQETGIGTAEIAARTCYDSFDSSENNCINEYNKDPEHGLLHTINAIEHSDLLDTLAWTHFHHSILEHTNLTYLIKGTSRGVLQEHARHRIQAISVRSTRYTMSSIINAFVAAKNNKSWFIEKFNSFDMLVTTDRLYNDIEATAVFEKLSYQALLLGDFAFNELAIAKSSLPGLKQMELRQHNTIFKMLETGKKKRNVGDNFKHIITDNVKVDMVVTFNLRSLKNYIELRASGSAYFQIQWLVEEMIKVTPKKYLELIMRKDKIIKILGT